MKNKNKKNYLISGFFFRRSKKQRFECDFSNFHSKREKIEKNWRKYLILRSKMKKIAIFVFKTNKIYEK